MKRAFCRKATSVAGYGQVEVHVLPVVDLVGGVRFTGDHKYGTSFIGGLWNPATPGDRINGTMTYTTLQRPSMQSFIYDDTQWSYVCSASTTSLTETRWSMQSIRAPLFRAVRFPC